MLVPVNAGEHFIDDPALKILNMESLTTKPVMPSAGDITDIDDQDHQTPNFVVPSNLGYVFPATIKDLSNVAIDNNRNGVEDFIEQMAPTYSDFEYIDTIVILSRPATDQLISNLEALGCIVDHKFTIMDALGLSIPITKLELVGREPGVEMIQSVHEVEKYLGQGVPIVEASQNKLSSAGYNGLTGEGVSIAIIDSGIEGSHSTFGNRIIAFKDFYGNQDDLDPTNGMNAKDYGYHGTMCASCAVGSGLYKGVAIKSHIIGVAVDNTYQMVQGIEWCVNNRFQDFNKDGEADGPDIITMSLGLQTTQRTYLDTAAERAMDNGVLFVTSAGNEGPNPGTVTSPATAAKVISVGAITKSKVIADFSSRGPGPGGILKPDIVAPGSGLTVAYPGNQWTGGGYGTSFASPIIAGIAALLLQYDPDLTTYEIKQHLLNSAVDRGDPGPDNIYGYGIADAISALDLVLKVKTLVASEDNVVEDTDVVFTATASGTNVEQFEWDFDNNGNYDETTEDGSASYVFSDAGDYEIKVRITNTQGKTAENSVQITVNNRKPTANLMIDGIPEYIYEDQPIKFNSSESWDTPSDINDLEFSWSFDDGLNFTNFSKDANSIEHIFGNTGEYKVKVKVKDDNDAEDEKTLSVLVYNMKPIADAGGDLIGFEEDLIQFSAFNTIDTASDLPSLDYVWDFGDGTKGYEMNVTHSYQTEYDNKTFTVTLTVVDNDNEKSTDKIRVTVKNRLPSILEPDDVFGNEDDQILLTGVGNDTKNDKTNLQYRWDYDDGESSNWLTTPITDHTYSQVGTYHPVLFVKDQKDAIGSRKFNVTIYNVKPIADFTMSQDSAEEDDQIEFDASNSVDTSSDIDALEYVWDFDDGSVEVGKMITHSFCKSKRYSIILTVKDDDGAIGTVEKKLTIANRRPVGEISIENDKYNVNDLVRVFGYKSTDSPSDKVNLTYYWNFGDGSGWEIAGINATHKYLEAGNFEIRLKIEDDDGEVNIKKVNITVTAPKEKEDIYANPTFENSGLVIYSALGVLLVILVIFLISLWMYYRNKKGIIGLVERRMKDNKKKKTELQNQQGMYIKPGMAPYPPIYTGITPEQEQFFKDYYGIHPGQAQQFIPGFVPGQQPQNGNNIPPVGMGWQTMPGPMSVPGQDTMQLQPQTVPQPMLPPSNTKTKEDKSSMASEDENSSTNE